VAARATLFPPGHYVAVMIDNAPQARPQSGIDAAPLVYELMAEGGITRYMAFFPIRRRIPTIGPVRSARIGFIDIDEAYGVPYAHAGGNVDALAALGRGVLPNLDEIYGSPQYFWRDPNEPMPHNLYTSSALLREALAQRRLPSLGLRPWPVGPPPPGGRRAPTVLLPYVTSPAYTYVVGWRWTGRRYERYVDGAPYLAADGRPVTAADVLILAIASVPDPDPYTPGAIKFVLTSGQGWLCRDGRAYPLTWRFSTEGGFRLSEGGRPVPFAVGGNVWVEVVAPGAPPEFTATSSR
jgi:hypothetical protein